MGAGILKKHRIAYDAQAQYGCSKTEMPPQKKPEKTSSWNY
jgi:hypothetical protein